MNKRPAVYGNLILLWTTWIIVAAGRLAWAEDVTSRGRPWVRHTIDDSSRGADGVKLADVDRNGRADLVFSCENAKGDKSGVMWLSSDGSNHAWTAHEISGPEGIKFDRMELTDVDGDGDTDVMACEESEPVDGKRHGLGVFWYENPTVATRAR